jgi:hypothetical protein
VRDGDLDRPHASCRCFKSIASRSSRSTSTRSSCRRAS